jgi:hypothetical protein
MSLKSGGLLLQQTQRGALRMWAGMPAAQLDGVLRHLRGSKTYVK